jgi:23S rRNA (uracil1939-C5)-methyltransferase
VSEQLVLKLDDLAFGGDAVGRHEGKAIFVPYGIPGEVVRVGLLQDKGRYARAKLLEILEPSPLRVQAPCPHFGRCGGCHWQHISYQAQLEYKQNILRTQLQRLSGLANAVVHPALAMSNPWHYRNHVQFCVSPNGALGFFAASSHRVVPVDQCLLMHSLLEELFEALDVELSGLQRLSLRAGIHTGEQMVIFEMDDDAPPEIEVDLPLSCILQLSDGTPVTLLGNPYLYERVASRTFRISPPSFFQVNTQQTETLITSVSAYLNPGQDDVVLDAYCGVGTLSLGWAAQCKRVIGIEESPSAIADAMANASDLGNMDFVHEAAEVAIAKLSMPITKAIVDPPRSGLDQAALAALIRLAPARIVYVSCDPATLARDAKGLLASGYGLREVQPVDMFPQTYHIESVSVFDRL